MVRTASRRTRITDFSGSIFRAQWTRRMNRLSYFERPVLQSFWREDLPKLRIKNLLC